MIFLMEYIPDENRIVSLCAYRDSAREEANEARLELELGLNRKGISREVVILEAESEDALRKTHGRYFKTLEELMKFIGSPSESQP